MPLDLSINWDVGQESDLEKYSNDLKRERRAKLDRMVYDRMHKAERQQLALEKLQSDDFQNLLKRYYKGGIIESKAGKSIDDFSKSELIEAFYQDRIWSEYNTAGIVKDVGEVLTKDEAYKYDWAEITQVYADLPYFGSKTIGFGKWAKDFIPSLIADPINLLSVGTGKVIAREAGKKVLSQLTKQEFVSQVSRKAALEIGIKEGTIGASVGAAADLARQTAEIDAGLMSDYNITRTLVSSAAGGVAQGTIGAAMSAWSAKGKAGKFYDKGDGFKSDYNRDFGLAGSEAETTYTGKSGKVKKVKNTTSSKNEPKKISDRTSEVPTLNNKSKEIKRKTPIINLSKIKADEPHNSLVKEVVDGIKTLIKEGKVRTTQRVGLFEQIKAKAAKLLSRENAELLDAELKAAAKMAPDLAPTVYAGRINWLLKSKEIGEIRNLLDKTVDVDEKLTVAEQLIQALEEKNILIKNHVDTVQAASDVMNQQKLIVELSEADKLRIETDKVLVEEITNTLNDVKNMAPNEKIEIIDKLAELSSNNDYKMLKAIKEANIKAKDKNVTLFEALNEYTTANLLFDPTTHEINIISTAINYQKQILEQYAGGLINLAKGNRQQGVNQLLMANDLLAGQFRFWQISLKKARLSWKANRSIGDFTEHRFDGRQQRNMETYLQQLQQSDNIFARWMGTSATPLGKLSFLSLRLLGAGDTLTKNIIQRAARVANVNQRIRTFYPELWKQQGKFNKAKIIKLQDDILDVKQNIRFEEAADKINTKKLKKLNEKLTELESQKVKQTPFEEKWSELYYQYEDEFGNFRETKTFNANEAETLDDLTKSVANDPTFVSRKSSFTENLQSEMLEANQFFPDQQQSDFNVGQMMLDFGNKHPALRILTGLHFIKTPANLFKTAWQGTPLFNRLNFEFNAMLKASDPVVRNKAQAIQGVGAVVYGFAFTTALFTDRLTGSNEKDRKHRYSYITYNEDGSKNYHNLSRFFPLSVPFMVAAEIRDAVNKMGDIWDDPLHSAEQERIIDFMSHVAGSSFSLWSNIFSSNLMTQDFFELTKIFSETEATVEEGQKNISKLEKYFGRSTSKLVPAATGWRWTNKVFAESEAELITALDHIKYSSPYGLSKIINEKYLGGQYENLNYADALSPKRDPLGNIYPKPRGVLLGRYQDVFPTTTHWSSSMVDSNGDKIVLSKQALEKIQTSNIQWERPAVLLDVGRKKSINLRETVAVNLKDPITNSIETLPEGTTLYEAMMIVKSKIQLGGKNLNETIRDELENPNSVYNKRYAKNRLVAGKYEGDQYLLDKIREYEQVARDWIKENAGIYVNDKLTNLNQLKQESESIIEKLGYE
jgi:hypothetical protein